eukprot:8363406-Pyramimonas_sp.AAC.1
MILISALKRAALGHHPRGQGFAERAQEVNPPWFPIRTGTGRSTNTVPKGRDLPTTMYFCQAQNNKTSKILQRVRT